MSEKRNLSTKKIVFSAAAVALATVTANFIKLPSLPAGGSASLFSMLFICLVGYWYGPVTGISAALAHGLIQFISNPYIVHPLQVILDYFLAFGALGLSGFFSKSKKGLIKGYTAGVLGRFIFSTLSGMIFFTEYIGSTADKMFAVWAGIWYNLSYIGLEYVLTMIVLTVPAVRKGLSSINK